jgi:cellulose synthase operon protein YhjU
MGAWSFYFLAKLYLYFRGYLRLDFVLNLLFIIFLVLPVPSRPKFHRSLTIAKYFLGAVFGLLLLWHESWLPPLRSALVFVHEQGMPSKEFVYRFLAGFFNPWEAAALVCILFLSFLIRNRVRLTPVVIILLLVVPVREIGHHKGEIQSDLDSFYRSESSRVVHFKKTSRTDFDIILLHVCSLSWDDLKGVGLETDRFFSRFDYLFTAFNSVTTYSNPSAIRLLRANCGQSGHNALYHDAPEDCYLLDALRSQGYETYFTFNHDGTYDEFAEEVGALGHPGAPLKPADAPIQAYNFDGSPIYDDYAVLKKWWEVRQRAPSLLAAVYYNTVSLHDGAHGAGDKEWWKRGRTDQYKAFVRKMFGDVTRFFDLVASSGRNTVILFVPEHGMALRGNPLQVEGLRDIPFAQITLVPVGVKLIGKGQGRDAVRRQIVSKPTSYLALSSLLASFLERSPFGMDGFMPDDLIARLPETDFVAENQGIRIVKKGVGHFLYGKEKKWIVLPANALM